jgi:hypothetical protein
MCVLIFSTPFVRSTSHSKKNSATYYNKGTQIMQVKRLSLLSLFKRNMNFLSGFSNNTQDIKFHENPSRGSRVTDLPSKAPVTAVTF